MENARNSDINRHPDDKARNISNWQNFANIYMSWALFNVIAPIVILNGVAVFDEEAAEAVFKFLTETCQIPAPTLFGIGLLIALPKTLISKACQNESQQTVKFGPISVGNKLPMPYATCLLITAIAMQITNALFQEKDPENAFSISQSDNFIMLISYLSIAKLLQYATKAIRDVVGLAKRSFCNIRDHQFNKRLMENN